MTFCYDKLFMSECEQGCYVSLLHGRLDDAVINAVVRKFISLFCTSDLASADHCACLKITFI